MENTYNWVVNSLDCIPLIDGQINVVSCIHWGVVATSSKTQKITNIDGSTVDIPYSSSTYGTQPLLYVESAPFTAYDDLTKATVIGWLKTALGATQVAAIQTSLDTQIANLENPPIVTPSLPWVN